MNPIFKKELTTSLRSKRNTVMVMAILFFLCMIMYLLWPRSGVFSLASAKSREIFSIFLLINLGFVLLIIPAFSSTSITTEKENNCFIMLYTTLLTPMDIMFGKLFASLWMLLLIIIMTLPISAVCALSGGISLPLLMQAYAVITVAAITYGIMGMACSAICERSATSLVMNYAGIAILSGATWLPYALFDTKNLVAINIMQMFRSISPFDALFTLLYPGRYELSTFAASAISPISLHFLSNFFISLFFLFVYYYYFKKGGMKRTAKFKDKFTDSKTGIKRKLGWPFYMFDPLKRKKPISWFMNPVFVAELRSKILGNPRFVIWCVSSSMIISLTLLIFVALKASGDGGGLNQADNIRIIAIVFQIGMVALLAPVISSSLITQEVNKGTLLLIRMTPISAFKFVMGKLYATTVYIVIILLSSLPILFAIAYLESEAAYWRIGAWLAVLFLTTTTLVTAGLFSSSFSKNTGISTAWSYGFSALLCVGTFSAELFSERISNSTATAILQFNPIVAALQITSDTKFVWIDRIWKNNLIILGSFTILFIILSSFRVMYYMRKRT